MGIPPNRVLDICESPHLIISYPQRDELKDLESKSHNQMAKVRE